MWLVKILRNCLYYADIHKVVICLENDKRVLVYGPHGQYVGPSYYHPNPTALNRKKVNLRLLDLLSDMIRRNKESELLCNFPYAFLFTV